jgi:aryl-alcohol dehydrogenase-like predicted oxidoreductase
MQYRKFGRTQWKVSEIGYGMWGLADWSGADRKEIDQSLARAIELGCNFFDTAWAYGDGKSEQILGNLIKNFISRQKFLLRILNGHLNHGTRWRNVFRLHTL